MSPCNCAREEADRMVSGGGLSISGRATAQDPRRIELIADEHFCGVVTECTTERVCRGLEYRDGCLGLKLSGDLGNRARIATDGGLYGDCVSEVTGLCDRGVSTLPAWICGGAYGAGLNVSPLSVLRSTELAVGMDLDLSVIRSYRTADRVFVTGPDEDIGDGNYVKPTPSWTGPLRDISSTELRNVRFDPDPAYGWPVQPCGLDFLSEHVAAARGHTVLSVEVPPESFDAGAMADMVEFLDRECAGDRVIVHLNAANSSATTMDADRAALGQARTAGYETGIQINDPAQAEWNPPAELAAEGVKWVYLHTALADSVIEPYVGQAGLQCLLWRPMLQSEAQRARDLGMRGVVSDDPSYACGKMCGRSRDSWCYPALPAGQVSSRSLRGQGFRSVRGAKIRDGCGWNLTIGPQSTDTSLTTLLGWVPPLPDPEQYTLTWELRLTETVNRGNSEVGLIIAAPTDAPFTSDRMVPPQTLDPALNDGYLLRWRIGQTSPAPAITPTVQITRLIQGQPPGPSSAVVNCPATPVNGWARFRAIVTPTSVRFGQMAGTTFQYVTELSTTVPATGPDLSPVRGQSIWVNQWQRNGTPSLALNVDIRNFERS
ncbi:hypothetical protein [Streptomyces yaizuensis]|uniref:Uncharacterized protein n=1 Tax=Streptomyces yaizuensis TaxID=2989713 RepID=A0AA86IWW6_9ACTN|nr:hypothetical protein [Streptomyces sp. YSPA8]BDT39538.1 hypothetical protein SYYSPA8_37100 [Streptomyces sp. YSPA8]